MKVLSNEVFQCLLLRLHDKVLLIVKEVVQYLASCFMKLANVVSKAEQTKLDLIPYLSRTPTVNL